MTDKDLHEVYTERIGICIYCGKLTEAEAVMIANAQLISEHGEAGKLFVMKQLFDAHNEKD